MRVRAVSGAIAAVVVAVSAVSCSLLFDNRGDAEALERQIRTMAGVADTDMEYHSDFENGERFTVTVQVSPDATDAQVSDIARSFAQGVATKKLNSHQTDLDLRLPIDPPPPKNNNATDYSDAGFHFGLSDTSDSPTVDDVADSAALWFRTAKSPTASRVDLLQPTWNGGHDSRQLTVTLRPEVTYADALALQASEHGLADASWQVSIVGDQMYRPHDYSSTPQPPTDSDLQLWRQISAVVGVSEDAGINVSSCELGPAGAGTTRGGWPAPRARIRSKRSEHGVADLSSTPPRARATHACESEIRRKYDHNEQVPRIVNIASMFTEQIFPTGDEVKAYG